MKFHAAFVFVLIQSVFYTRGLIQHQTRPSALPHPHLHLPKGSRKSKSKKKGNIAQPHILVVIGDDVGYAGFGYSRANYNASTDEVRTPNIDALVEDGIQLSHHYAFKSCSPSRSAFQSGRNPIYVNVANGDVCQYDRNDDEGGYAGIPRSMTGIAEVMRKAGYRTHMVGKWDAGMATPQHIPEGRGYDTSFVYFGHTIDYFNHHAYEVGCGRKRNHCKDLWETPLEKSGSKSGQPGTSYTNQKGCSYKNQGGGNCTWSDTMFKRRVLDIIGGHDTSTSAPLFLVWATHVVHGPLQLFNEQLEKFSFIDHVHRQIYHAMINWLDDAIGDIVTLLKNKDMYDNTLIVFFSDNGGAYDEGGNNYPLRGYKFSSWEGGIRVIAWVAGGYLPQEVRGTTQEGLTAVWDWYATFAYLAGVEDPTDKRAEAAGLPAVDSKNLWPLLIGEVNEAREYLLLGDDTLGGEGSNVERMEASTTIGGVIVPPYKLLIGRGPRETVRFSMLSGILSPNNSFKGSMTISDNSFAQKCSWDLKHGCLFDVWADPSEQVNLAQDMPETFQRLRRIVKTHLDGVYSPRRGAGTCEKAVELYDGYLGPFMHLDSTVSMPISHGHRGNRSIPRHRENFHFRKEAMSMTTEFLFGTSVFGFCICCYLLAKQRDFETVTRIPVCKQT